MFIKFCKTSLLVSAFVVGIFANHSVFAEQKFPDIHEAKYQLQMEGTFVSEEVVHRVESLDRTFDVDKDGTYDVGERRELKKWHKALQKSGFPIILMEEVADYVNFNVLAVYWDNENRGSTTCTAQLYAINRGTDPWDSVVAAVSAYKESSSGSNSWLKVGGTVRSDTNIPSSLTKSYPIGSSVSFPHYGQRMYFRADVVATDDGEAISNTVASDIF